MKKLVNIRGLQEYVTHHKINSVLFYTENQRWYCTLDPCKIRMAFPIMLIHENPNLICLKSGKHTITFDGVKSVEIDTGATVLGTVFTVFCGEFGSKERDTIYTLIAV